jgi:hypothetical protein
MENYQYNTVPFHLIEMTALALKNKLTTYPDFYWKLKLLETLQLGTCSSLKNQSINSTVNLM